MKQLVFAIILALVLASALPSRAETSIESDPAYLPIDKMLDLKAIQPEVNVNLPRFLLKDAASELSTGTNAPLAGTGVDLAELIKDVKLIRFVVIEANETNRTALAAGVKKLRADLDGKWTALVSVPEENVGIYAKEDSSGESMAGLAVLIYDGDDAVIGNVVGKVSVGKLIKLASGMDKMPKDLLKKLQSIGNQPGKKTTSEDDPKDAKDKKAAGGGSRPQEESTAK
jgi:hypothetical protein